MNVDALKERAKEAIDECAGELYDLSHDIWEHPELGHEEHHAHDIITQFLERKGFQVCSFSSMLQNKQNLVL